MKKIATDPICVYIFASINKQGNTEYGINTIVSKNHIGAFLYRINNNFIAKGLQYSRIGRDTYKFCGCDIHYSSIKSLCFAIKSAIQENHLPRITCIFDFPGFVFMEFGETANDSCFCRPLEKEEQNIFWKLISSKE